MAPVSSAMKSADDVSASPIVKRKALKILPAMAITEVTTQPFHANETLQVTGVDLLPAGTAAGDTRLGSPAPSLGIRLVTEAGHVWPVALDGPFSAISVWIKVGGQPPEVTGDVSTDQRATLTLTHDTQSIAQAVTFRPLPP